MLITLSSYDSSMGDAKNKSNTIRNYAMYPDKLEWSIVIEY